MNNHDKTYNTIDAQIEEIFSNPEYEPLTPDEEVELFKIYKKNKDPEVYDKIFNANQKFIVLVARGMEFPRMPLSDKIQEGRIGLMIAIDRFDVTRGFKFISYAVHWIKQRMRQSYFENYKDNVRRPLNVHGLTKKVLDADERYSAETEGLPPSEMYLKEQTGYGGKENILNLVNHRERSLHSNVSGNGDHRDYSEIIEDPNEVDPTSALDRLSLKKVIEDMLDEELSEKEALILRNFFGISCRAKTLQEIGDEMGLTRERVRQIKEKGLRKFRVRKRARILRQYLG